LRNLPSFLLFFLPSALLKAQVQFLQTFFFFLKSFSLFALAFREALFFFFCVDATSSAMM